MENKDNDLIEAYFDGRLDASQQATVELRVAKEEGFAAAFEQRKEMQTYLKNIAKQEKLEQQLDQIGQPYFQGETAKVVPLKKEKPNQSRLAMLTALVTAAAVAFLLILFNPFKQASLYEQYALHEPLNLTEKSATDDQLAAKAEIAFNEKQYPAAVTALEAYLAQNPTAIKASLFKAIALLETGQFTESRAILTRLSKGKTALKVEAQWYLALSYLKVEEIAATRKLLAEIPESDAYWYNKAQKLLKELPKS
ncbi:MAG: tetratricopeptide repeat protein [Saprospiraceae bacterium]